MAHSAIPTASMSPREGLMACASVGLPNVLVPPFSLLRICGAAILCVDSSSRDLGALRRALGGRFGSKAEPDGPEIRLPHHPQYRTLSARSAMSEKCQHRKSPPHSITSSAVATRVCGTVRPSALAVLRLITSATLVDCCTGRSAGLSPFRIRST